MYNLPHFKEKDQQKVIEFMKQHPFAMIIANADNRAFASQVPLMFDEREGKILLCGHMMKKQDHQLALEKNPAVLVVFTGPHTYVSASWYSNPHQASTWNYMSVHARGHLKFLDQKGLEAVLKRLTLQYENNNPQSPTVFDNLPEEYRNKLMKSIIAFEIEVNSFDNVFKLSQNRDEKSFDTIMHKLNGQNEDARSIANEMQQRGSQLFNAEGM